jgi:hypothetical protein
VINNKNCVRYRRKTGDPPYCSLGLGKCVGCRNIRIKLEGRPDREKPIAKEDIINLKIELESSQSVKEFLEAV